MLAGRCKNATEHRYFFLVTCVFCSGWDKWDRYDRKSCNDHKGYSRLFTAKPNRMEENLNIISSCVRLLWEFQLSHKDDVLYPVRITVTKVDVRHQNSLVEPELESRVLHGNDFIKMVIARHERHERKSWKHSCTRLICMRRELTPLANTGAEFHTLWQ